MTRFLLLATGSSLHAPKSEATGGLELSAAYWWFPSRGRSSRKRFRSSPKTGLGLGQAALAQVGFRERR
jgi:hypothetical protein